MWFFIHFFILVHFTIVNCYQSNNVYTAVPNAFFKDCLLEINKYRKLHGAYPLRWSNDLQYHAQSRADELASEELLRNDIVSLDRLGQGETVSYLSPPKDICHTYPPSGDCYACRESIATWYNESKYYNYRTGYSIDGTKQVLHFTQLVWKDSVKVGLAIAFSRRYGVIIVARYHPRGNIGFLDDYVRNVASRVEGGDDKFNVIDEDRGQGSPSCRKLRRRKSNKECLNLYGDELCDVQAKKHGYCEYEYQFMKINCAKSCGFCPGKSKEAKKMELYWKIGKWEKCHGGFQRRIMECFHTYEDKNYLVKNKFCEHQLGEEPTQYKDCILVP